MNAAQYIGIPFVFRGRDKAVALDCWGLACCIYRDQLNIILPTYDAYYDDIRDVPLEQQIGALGSRIADEPGWFPIPLCDARCFDIAQMRGYDLQTFHVGIFLSRDKIIHTTAKTGVIIERVNNLKTCAGIVKCWRSAKASKELETDAAR